MSKTYLFIGAHPDDIEIGCGATVAKMINEGHRCVFIIATNGEQGSFDHSNDDLAKLRQNEAITAANILGVSEVHFLELPDGITEFSIQSKIKLIKLIREIKPHVAFIHSSSDQHPDHKLIHTLCISSLNSAAGPWFPEAGKSPHETQEIYGFEVWNAINNVQLTIDISKFIDLKLKALSAHQSQISNFPYMNAVIGLNQYRGAITGGGHAEAFEVIKTQL